MATNREGDVVIRFIADASNYRSFLSSSPAMLNQFARELNAFSNQVFMGKGGPLQGVRDIARTSGGFGFSKNKIEVDAFNNTLRYTRDIYKQVVNEKGKAEAVLVGSAKTARGNWGWMSEAGRSISTLNNLIAAQTKLADKSLEAQTRLREARRLGFNPATAQTIFTGAGATDPTAAITQIRQFETLLRQNKKALKAAVSGSPAEAALISDRQTLLSQRSSLIMPGYAGKSAASLEKLVTNLGGLEAATTKASSNWSKFIRRFGDIPALTAQRSEMQGFYQQARAMSAGIPGGISTIQQQSPQLYAALRRSGLGGTIDASQAATLGKRMLDQGVSTRMETDLVRGVTRVNVAWHDQVKGLQSVSAEYDKFGRVVTRWGGQFSGLSQMFRQVGRDILKVAEWTIATTAIIGGLRVIEGTITTINNLDKTMRQYGITAGLTQQQTRDFFGQIAKVATETATPLQEMAKAFDDIALATRKAGQSQAAWQTAQVNLATAVGVLTNLGNMDTVKATEVLTSTMKQMGVNAGDLIGILSKVTAVAGGQSNAIQDITQGLAVMSEAGKQAGLNVNQQIATVQVLSQVTSKSSSEVAVAFKNLVGSIDSTASIKMLKQYGIAVRDEQGNFRNFLDIYKEIQDKISSGVIPAGQVKAVIKAISGGPRRAPDAAALLANVNQIFAVEQKAVTATNEAFIANNKVLDTTQAKIVQLQNTFQQMAFEKFGAGVKQSFDSIITSLTGFSTLINNMPNEIISVATSIGVLAVSMRIATAAMSTGATVAGNFVKNIKINNELKNLMAIAPSDKAGLKLFNQQQKLMGQPKIDMQAFMAMGGRNMEFGPASRFLSGSASGLGWGSLGKALAIPLALGGVSALATGAGNGFKDLGATVGSFLQTAGMASLMIPELSGTTKLLGIAAIAAGTGIQFLTSQADKNTDAMKNLAEAQQQALQAYQDTNDNLATNQKTQRDLNNQIQKFETIQNKTVEDISAEAEARKQLGIEIQKEVALRQTLASVQKDAAKLGIPDMMAALTGLGQGMTSAQAKEMQQKLYPTLFGLSEEDMKQGIYLNYTPMPTYGRPRLGPPSPLNQTSALSNSAGGMYLGGSSNYAAGYGVPETTTSLGDTYAAKVKENLDKWNSITSGQASLKDFLAPNGKSFTDVIPRTKEGLIEVVKLIADMNQKGEETASLTEAFNDLNISVNETARGLAIADRNIKAIDFNTMLGLMSPEQSQNAKGIQRMLGDLYGMSANLPERFPGMAVGGMGPKARFQQELGKQAFVNGRPATTISLETLQNDWGTVLKTHKELEGAFVDGKLSMEAAKGIAEQYNITITGLIDPISQVTFSTDQLDAATKNLADTMSATKGAGANYARDLYMRVARGDITQGQANKMWANMSQVINPAQQIASMQEETIAAADTLPVFQEMMDKLGKMPILMDMNTESVTGFVQSLLQFATSADLSAKGAANFGTILSQLSSLLIYLSSQEFKIDVTQTITTIRNEPGYWEGEGGYRGPAGPTASAAADIEIRKKIKEKTGYNSIDEMLAAWAKMMGAKGNFNIPGSGSSKSTPSVQMLDYPTELKPYLPGMVNEIIAKARTLQHQLPGEDKKNKDAIVAIMDGTKILAKVYGVGQEELSRVMKELTDVEKQRLQMEQKADMLQRIRVGTGSFAALANVPLNSRTGVSVGGPQGPITVNLNINGQIMNPAYAQQIGEAIAAQIKSNSAGALN